MKRNRKIAITGGIGSGKSALCDILRGMGCAVFSCDEISHRLWENGEYRRGLAELFPSCAKAGDVDKKALTNLVFSDPISRKLLESYAHPRIMRQLYSEMERCPLAFAEVPLLYEGGYENDFDGVVVVERKENARVRAVALRDGAEEEEVRARIGAQAAVREGGRAVLSVRNDGDLSALRKEAEKVLLFAEKV